MTISVPINVTSDIPTEEKSGNQLKCQINYQETRQEQHPIAMKNISNKVPKSIDKIHTKWGTDQNPQ